MGMPPTPALRLGRSGAVVVASMAVIGLASCSSTAGGSGPTPSRGTGTGSSTSPADTGDRPSTPATSPPTPPAATTSAPSASSWRTELVTPSATTKAPPTSGVDPTGVDPALAPYVDLAKADLAKRLSVTADRITVVAAAITTWPDASMGCPKPGMSYAPKPVDGSVIVLSAGGKDYAYHAGDATPPFLCEP